MATYRVLAVGLARASRQLLRRTQCTRSIQLAVSRNVVRSPTTRVRWYSSDENKPKYTQEYFEGLVKDKPLVLFMKGEPSAPMCGFSRLVVQILHMHGLEGYSFHNILEDMEFKEGMKTFSNWPTFPQVYMNGELVGGADIMLQLHQSGELVSELDKIGHKSALLNEEVSS